MMKLGDPVCHPEYDRGVIVAFIDGDGVCEDLDDAHAVVVQWLDGRGFSPLLIEELEPHKDN